MPEYLAPGVYVEEVSFRSKSIEGVSTSTAGFIGPTATGPVDGVPELITSTLDYERLYGGIAPLDFEGSLMINFTAQSVRAFFENGGKRLYVSRVFSPLSSKDSGKASKSIASVSGSILVEARYPGESGNGRCDFTIRRGQNVLIRPDMTKPSGWNLSGASKYDMIIALNSKVPVLSPPFSALFWCDKYYDEILQRQTFRFYGAGNSATALSFDDMNNLGFDDMRIVTMDISMGTQIWQGLSFHPDHPATITKIFAETADNNRSQTLYLPIVVTPEKTLTDPIAIAEVFLDQNYASDPDKTLFELLLGPDYGKYPAVFSIILSGGNDGLRPASSFYEGEEDKHSGLYALGLIDDISIIAAPGASFKAGSDDTWKAQNETITSLLLSHCESMRYRVAVLDSPDKQLLSDIRAYRAKIDSKYAALYFPWITIVDPSSTDSSNATINVPPSGFMAGIYARSDIETGVHKAPANEVVRLAVDLELRLNKAQQDVLNPEGINCLRFFEGRGFRIWGARTASSDPEWKYVNVRRYFAFVEHSIDKGTQWAVFEPNGDALWANIQLTIADFLYNEWVNGHLLGVKAEQAYFVRCDRSTMTQNDLDNGRLICLIGISVLKPAEFVIFRIGQWTADRKV
jgi:uncharacterized protein